MQRRRYPTPNHCDCSPIGGRCSCLAPAGGFSRRVGGPTFDPSAFFEAGGKAVAEGAAVVFGAAGDAVAGAGEAACNLLPPQIRNLLDVTQQQPWHGIATAASLTIPNLLVHALPPVSYAAGIFVLPGVLVLNTARLSFNFLANCGDVSRTLKREACTIEEARLLLAGPIGGVLKTVLRAGGQEQVIPALDSIVDSGEHISGRMCRGHAPDLNAVRDLALALATQFAPELQSLLENWDDLDELFGMDVGAFFLDELARQGVPVNRPLQVTGTIGPVFQPMTPTPSTESSGGAAALGLVAAASLLL